MLPIAGLYKAKNIKWCRVSLHMCDRAYTDIALSADAEAIWCVRSIFCNDGYVFPLHARCEYEVPRQA